MSKRVKVTRKDGNAETYDAVDRVRTGNGLLQVIWLNDGILGEHEIGINIDRIDNYEITDMR